MEEPPMQSPSFGQTQEETKEEKVEMTENIGPMRVEENEAEGPSGGEEYEDKQNDEGETPSNQVEEAEPRQDENQEEEAIPQEEEGGDQPVEVNIEVQEPQEGEMSNQNCEPLLEASNEESKSGEEGEDIKTEDLAHKQEEPGQIEGEEKKQEELENRPEEPTPPIEGADQAQDYTQTPPRATQQESAYSRYSPAKSRIEESLCFRLKDQMAEDTRVEFLKEELALKADFNLGDAFNFFDLDRRGRITHLDIKDVLTHLGVYSLSEECKILVDKFDTNKDGVLDRVEFEQIFLPNDPVTSKQLKERVSFNKDSYYSPKYIFTTRTQILIADVLKAEIMSEKIAENVRQRLRLETSSLKEAFDALDKTGKGHISKWDMSAIMDEHRVNTTRGELNSFMDRYDKDKDGKVTFDEVRNGNNQFAQEMLPKSPSRLY